MRRLVSVVAKSPSNRVGHGALSVVVGYWRQRIRVLYVVANMVVIMVTTKRLRSTRCDQMVAINGLQISNCL